MRRIILGPPRESQPTMTDTFSPAVLRRPDLPCGLRVIATCEDLITSVSCEGCSQVTYGGANDGSAWLMLMADHLRQHLPGRACDLTDLDWRVFASCTVCDSGGDIQLGDDGDLVCLTCGTWWDAEGRNGRRSAPAAR